MKKIRNKALLTFIFIFLFAMQAEAGEGGIAVKLSSSYFYISARCYTEGGEHSVGPWRVNMGWHMVHRCNVTHGRHPSYIKIKRKNAWFQDRGSAWRVTRNSYQCEPDESLCVDVYGYNLGTSRYSAKCKRSCF